MAGLPVETYWQRDPFLFTRTIAEQPNSGLGRPIVEVSVLKQLETRRVGLLWTSDQLVAKAAT